MNSRRQMPAHLGDLREGFSSVDLLIVVGTVVVLGLVVVPYIIRMRARAAPISCVNHMKQIGYGFRGWAIDHGDYPMSMSNRLGGTLEYSGAQDAYRYFQTVGSEMGLPEILICPTEKRRKPASDFATFGNANLSYFINIDASEKNPGALLAGDRHISTNRQLISLGMLTLTTNTAVQWTKDFHNGAGNVLLADGSAQQLDNRKLRSQLLMSTNSTERLLIP